jgi:hypothetical protein
MFVAQPPAPPPTAATPFVQVHVKVLTSQRCGPVPAGALSVQPAVQAEQSWLACCSHRVAPLPPTLASTVGVPLGHVHTFTAPALVGSSAAKATSHWPCIGRTPRSAASL